MPPKKSAGKGGKGKDTGDKHKESLRLAQTEIEHLQQHIEIQKHDLQQARDMQNLWQQRCEENLAAFEREKQDLQDIAKDKARKSTVQSDQKQITIEGLETKVEDLQRKNSLLQSQLETVESKNANAAGEHAKEVRELRQRLQTVYSECTQLMTKTIHSFKKDLLTPYIGDLQCDDE